MPASESNCGRRQPCPNNYKFNSVRHDGVQDTGLVNGTTHCDKTTYVYGPRIIHPTKAASDSGIKPRNMMNGYVNNGFRSNRHEMTQECSRAKRPECNSTLVNGSRSPGRGPPSTTICDQEPPKPGQLTATKIQRKKRKPWHKKRNNHVENSAPTEDWEGEIQEVKISNWAEMSFGTQPYGPEDVVNFTLRSLSLDQSRPPLWQVTCCNKYLPATHHRRPIEWARYKPCSVPGQFSDVED